MQDYFSVLIGSPLFAGLHADELPSMLDCLNAHKNIYPKDSFILHAGDPVCAVGIVAQGEVHIIKEDFWGNRMILAQLEAGNLFAESFSCSDTAALPVSVVASKPSVILFVDYQKIVSVCSSACIFHTQLIKNMLGILAQKNIALTQKMEHISQRSTRDKLLSYLSAQAVAAQSSSFSIPFDRQQLADYLSVDRSAMSSTLCKMRDEGLLTFHKNQFTLHA